VCCARQRPAGTPWRQVLRYRANPKGGSPALPGRKQKFDIYVGRRPDKLGTNGYAKELLLIGRTKTVRCLLAMELTKKSRIVPVNTPLSEKFDRHTLQACDWKRLLELIVRFRRRVSQAFNRPVESSRATEAGYEGFCLTLPRHI
jgi:hypothetical protein